MIAAAVVTDMQKMWHNGTRLNLVAFLVLLAAAIFFAAISLYAWVALRQDVYAPMTFHSPAQIISVEGDHVHATIERCNSEDQDLAVEGAYSVRDLETHALIPQGSSRFATWAPGCTVIDPTITLLNVPPGTYRLEGVTIARSDTNKTQVAAWYSDPFTVNP